MAASLVFETPGGTRYYFDPGSIRVGEVDHQPVRTATVTTVSKPGSPGFQASGEGELQVRCSDRAYRTLRSIAIRKNGERIEVVPYRADRAFTPTQASSPDRQMADAICISPVR